MVTRITLLLTGILFVSQLQAQTNANGNALPSAFQVQLIADKNRPALSVHINNPSENNLHIRIYQQNLAVFVDTTISGRQFSKRYVFSDVQDGRYRLQVSNGKERFQKEFEINTIVRRDLSLH